MNYYGWILEGLKNHRNLKKNIKLCRKKCSIDILETSVIGHYCFNISGNGMASGSLSHDICGLVLRLKPLFLNSKQIHFFFYVDLQW